MTGRDRPHDPGLQRALIALLEDEATDHAQLDALLREDDAACDQYLNMIRLHAMLQREFGGLAPMMRVQGSGFRVQRSKSALRNPKSEIVFALAAALALMLTAWFVLQPEPGTLNPEPSDTAVAILTDAPGARWAGSVDGKTSGASLEAGPLQLLEGRAQIMFHNGAVVDLQGPAEFDLVGESRGVLRRGTISAWVPSRAVGFTIDTPDCRIVDLGTEFTVAVDPAVFTRLAVLRGKVKLTPNDDAAWSSHILFAGSVAQIAGNGLDLDVADADAPVQRVLVDEPFDAMSTDLDMQRMTAQQTIHIDHHDASTFGPSWNRAAIAVVDHDPAANLFAPLLSQPIPDDGDPHAPLQIRFDFKLHTGQQNPCVQIANRDGASANNMILSVSLAYPASDGAYLAYAPERGAPNLMAKMITGRWYRLTLSLDRAQGRFSVDLLRRSADGTAVDEHLHFDGLQFKHPYTVPAHVQWIFNVPPGRGGDVLIDNLRISLPLTSTVKTTT